MMLPRRCLNSSVPSSLLRSRQSLSTSAKYATSALTRASIKSGISQVVQHHQHFARPSFVAASHTLDVGSRQFQTSALRLAETVKVPQMAESITEGTLKQWNKKKGDFVNADEEVATIETDKVSYIKYITVRFPH